METGIEHAEFLADFPWELVIEILSWLSVRTLMQFKCVSKSWKSLISDDKSFEKLHLQRSHKKKHMLLTLRDTNSPWYEEVEADDCLIPCPVRRLVENSSSMTDEDGCYNLKGKYYVIGSCNGLVCFQRNWSYDRGPGRCRVLLWNPATRLWSNKSPTFSIDNRVSLGFGYDDSRDIYKVVGLSDYVCCRGWKLVTVVYSMGDSCWRKISSDPGFRLSLMGNYGQFVGGCLNWLAIDNSNSPDCNHHNHLSGSVTTDILQLVIVSFDMRKEAYRSLSLPEGTSEDIPTDLTVLGNCLCLFQDHNGTHFNVWQMREYGVQESWTRLVKVSYEHLQSDGFMIHQPSLMCLSEDGDILMLYKNQNWDVILYNVRDNSVKHVQLPANKSWLNANSYVQSLVSPY